MKNKSIRNNKYSAFTFIELMVSIFIMSVIMLAAVSVFAKIVLARQNAGTSLRDVSAAREAMQIMAKNMRVSSQLNYLLGDHKTIYFLNQSTGLCVSYRFSNNSLYVATASGSIGTVCSAATYSGYSQIVDPSVNLNGSSFQITPTDVTSTPKVIGKGTIFMIVDGKNSLQTTVSFLDYVGTIY